MREKKWIVAYFAYNRLFHVTYMLNLQEIIAALVFKHLVSFVAIFSFLIFVYWLPQSQACQLQWMILICFIMITILQLFSTFIHCTYNKNDTPNILIITKKSR